jgi:hypothetical protein
LTPDSEVRTFRSRAQVEPSGRIVIPVPFDPAEVWGARDRYHLTYTIDGRTGRTTIEGRDGPTRIALGPKSGQRQWVRDGDEVEVSLRPEGPHSATLAADVAFAFDADPAARQAFDSLATFYRKGWLTWIDGTKRRPDLRAERIAKMVDLVRLGHKERPR